MALIGFGGNFFQEHKNLEVINRPRTMEREECYFEFLWAMNGKDYKNGNWVNLKNTKEFL